MEPSSTPARIIVIGTSAGGIKAVSELIMHLPGSMDSAILLVMHVASTSLSQFLLLRLQPLTSWKCQIPLDGDIIEKGSIYIAPANGHLIVNDDHVTIGHGPAESRWKPSIDILFRSAAAAWSNRVIGIILTGMLDDGTTGMIAIRKSGGICIIQDPNEAEYPGMPLSVLDQLIPDYCLPVLEIRSLLPTLVAEPVIHINEAPQEVKMEAAIAERVAIDYTAVEQLGEPSRLSCPQCGGGLFEINEPFGDQRYRCHVGHMFTQKGLESKQIQTIENTLWIAIRMMEERRNLLIKLGNNYEKKGFKMWQAGYEAKSGEMDRHVQQLKELLFNLQQAASQPGHEIEDAE